MKKFEITISCTTEKKTLVSSINADKELNAMEVIQVLDTQSRLLKASVKAQVDAEGYTSEKKRIYRAKRLKLGEISKHTG